MTGVSTWPIATTVACDEPVRDRRWAQSASRVHCTTREPLSLVRWGMNRRRTLSVATVGVLLASGASARPGGGQPAAPRRARPGDNRGGAIRLPVFLDLKKVRVGSWAEYTVSRGGRAPRTVRQVLLDRDKTSATVEVITEVRGRKPARPLATDRKVTRMVVDVDLREIAPREIVVQRRLAARPTVLSAADGTGRQRLFKLDPKKSLRSETVAVAAGTFETQHYRDIGPRGGTIDIWASTQAPPFGLVKMERTPSANAPARRAAFGQVTYALVRMGSGAKPFIIKAPEPLNPDLIQCRVGSPKQTKP